MAEIKISYNGYDLSEYIKITGLNRNIHPPRINDTQSVGRSDGLQLIKSRYNAKSIVVDFVIISDNFNAERRALAHLLASDTLAPLIFSDEPDKYWNAIVDGASDLSEDFRYGRGSITFLVSDGVAHSIIERVHLPELDNGTTFGVNYAGTYKSYPVLQATMKGDNGFVAFINQRGKTLQFGNPSETDSADVKKSETVINDVFNSASVLDGYSKNNTRVVTNGKGEAHEQVGSMYINENRLKPYTYGTGTYTGYHGPSISKAIPADSKGNAGAVNGELQWKMQFSTTGNGNNTMNLTEIVLLDKSSGTSKNIAGMAFYKHRLESKRGVCHLHVNDKIVGTIELNLDTDNPLTGSKAGQCSIKKFGSKVTFTIQGKAYPYTVPAVANMQMAVASVYFAAYKGYSNMTHNTVSNLKFIDHYVENWQDVPNKFSKGDVLLVDCNTGTTYLNGIQEDGLGALGNDWEDFYLLPGVNQINCVRSDWATQPDCTLKYREVYL